VLESPVTIVDADRPIGTHVFTALARSDREDEMRWSVVSLDGGRPQAATVDRPSGARAGASRRDAQPVPASSDGAKAALDRIVIPQEALDRIAEMASPRSSLIISDEPLSSETGKDTEFVVVLSDEPQGSLKIRRPARPRDRLPFAGAYSTW
jgi:hypothetical protein